MGIRVDQLPRLFLRILKNFDTQVILKEVSTLEEEDALFVEDGNHGEYRPLADEFVDIGVPFVRPPNLVDGRIDLNLCQKINETAFRRVRKGIGKGGDIVLTHNATVGRLAITNDNDPVFVTNPQTTVWRSKNRDLIDPKFLYYFMCSSGFQEQLDSHKGRNATFDYVSLTKQRSLVIPVVNIDLQRDISQVLSSLDNKITLNRQLNQTLEQMAQTLFKSWFVDFDPVIDNALAAGNPIPDDLQDRAERRQLQLAKADHKPLPESIRKLFPSEFELTESLGWVPLGWGTSPIKNFCEKIQNGGTPNRSTSEYWDNGTIPWLTSGEVRQKVVTKTENFITELGLKGSSAKPVAAGSTLIAMYGATAGQVAFSSVEVTTNQAVCALIPKQNCKYFVYLAMERCVASLENQARGSAQQNISKGIIEETLSVMPSVELLAQFDQVCASFFVSWISNINMNEELAKLRDTLLPKLISGELRIPEAQAQLEEALG